MDARYLGLISQLAWTFEMGKHGCWESLGTPLPRGVTCQTRARRRQARVDEM